PQLHVGKVSRLVSSAKPGHANARRFVVRPAQILNVKDLTNIAAATQEYSRGRHRAGIRELEFRRGNNQAVHRRGRHTKLPGASACYSDVADRKLKGITGCCRSSQLDNNKIP